MVVHAFKDEYPHHRRIQARASATISNGHNDACTRYGLSLLLRHGLLLSATKVNCLRTVCVDGNDVRELKLISIH